MNSSAGATTDLRDPDRRLALNYVPRAVRARVEAVWMLDEALGRVVQSTTQPMIGQMRLTWWHDRLCALDRGEVAPTPLLRACVRAGVGGALLAQLVEGWEALLDPLPLSDAIIAEHAGRGRVLFAATAALVGGACNDRAGEGWAAMDLARHCSDRDTAVRARAFARERLTGCPLPQAKALRVLTRLALGDCRRAPGSRRPRSALLSAVLR